MDTKIRSRLVREPMLNGIWYPDNKEDLLDSLALQLIKKNKNHDLDLILVPAASMDIVGSLYGQIFSTLDFKNFERVLMISFLPQARFHGIFIPESDDYKTLLGLSPIDTGLAEIFLDSSTLSRQDDTPHLQSNAFEIFTTFLHYFMPRMPILPVLACPPSEALIRSLAGGILLADQELPGKTLIALLCDTIGPSVPKQSPHTVNTFYESVLKKINQKQSNRDYETLRHYCTQNNVPLCMSACVELICTMGHHRILPDIVTDSPFHGYFTAKRKQDVD
jgi:AmmeMemoRadiSam system protein B